MSYDIDILAPPVPRDDAQAWLELERREDETGAPAEILRELHDRLTARYPCISTLSETELDASDTPWSSGPLIDDFGPQIARFAMVFSRFDTALPFIIETAGGLGLVVFDAQTKQIHRGDGLRGLKLSIEDDYALHAPTPEAIGAAIDRLTPDGGPGFLILEGRSESYAQVGGGDGDGAYAVEWRECFDGGFRHWAAGEPGRISERPVVVKGNGAQFTVREHERLAAADAKAILQCFALEQGRPPHYAWRDMTADLETVEPERPWWKFWS